jgi:alkaline phosphatase D
MSYQWIHGPRNYDQWGATPQNDGRKLYYSFECGGYPFFVMDSRTQRMRDDDDYVLEDNHLLGFPAKTSDPEYRAWLAVHPPEPGDPAKTAADYKGQIDILCDWLVTQQAKNGNRPKFIVSPSVFVPNGVQTAGADDDKKARQKKCEDDSWAAFPVTRRQLLQTIVEKGVQNVLFLSGDVHCSNVAEISFVHRKNGELPLRAFSITSSAFYWPWAFADGDPLTFVHNSDAERDNFQVNDDVAMTYCAYNFEQEDNFTQVEIANDEIITRNYGRDGNLLQTSKLKLA